MKTPVKFRLIQMLQIWAGIAAALAAIGILDLVTGLNN
jgi:hypothetical protein